MLMEKNYIYVDKTSLIYEIAQEPTAFIINAERRTGKTLLLSTIQAIFKEPKSWWEEHCKNLKIWQVDPNFFDNNPYPVIQFNFANSPNNKAFINRIREAINNAITTYKLPLKDIEEKITLEELVDVKSADVFNKLKAIYNKPALITIDEADQPMINQIFNERIKDENLRAKRMSKIIKSFNIFYGYLKAKMASGHVRLVVVAGHSMISKSAIYSGNIVFFSQYSIINFCYQHLTILLSCETNQNTKICWASRRRRSKCTSSIPSNVCATRKELEKKHS